MSSKVTLTDGVSTTLAVFGQLHNAFLSALPTPGKASIDPTMTKRRYLEEFADLYQKAVASSLQLHDSNDLKEALKKFTKENGDVLIAFAAKWSKYLKSVKSAKLPTQSDQKFVSDYLEKLGQINVQDDKGRSKAIEFLVKLTKEAHYSKFAALKAPDSLGGIISTATSVAHSRAAMMNRLDPSTSGYGYTTKLTAEEMTNKIEAAAATVSGSVISAINSDTATWFDLTELTDVDRVALEFTGKEMDIAKNLMRTMDGLYTLSGMVHPMLKFLSETAPAIFETAAAAQGTAPENVDHADKLRKYAGLLRQLADELKAFQVSASSSTPLTSFAAQFPLTKTIREAGTLISSSRIATDSPWSKTLTAPYRSGYSGTDQYTSPAATFGASTGSGSGPGSSGGAKAGTTGGMLWRTIDLDRVAQCNGLVNKFVSMVDDTDRKTMERVLQNAKTFLEQITANIDQLRHTNPDDNVMKLDGLRNQQVIQVTVFLTRARGVLMRHMNRHVTFALRTNRGALRYMLYWSDSVPATKQLTQEYFDKLKEITKKGEAETDAIAGHVESLMREGSTYTGMNDSDIERVVEKFEGIRAFKQQCKDRIAAVHRRPSTFLDQLLTDAHVHVIYALKGVRFALAWMAMSVATRAFLSVYANNVYVKNIDPPPPALFILMFFGVNIAMNAGLLTVLWAANKVFKSPTNDFPIDSYMLSAWTADVGCSELAMVGISLAFGSIIATKKAFRYRQEGDRGIRALGQMMLYSYAVVLAIPFFRVV